MARIVLLGMVLVLAVIAISYFAYRLFLKREEQKSAEAEREHERRMARDKRNYDELMAHIDTDRQSGDDEPDSDRPR